MGDHELDVGWTDYSKRAYYASHSLTFCLKPGTNVLGAALGNGWFAEKGGQPGHHNAPPQPYQVV